MKLNRMVSLALMALALAGCVKVGPRTVQADRFDYNEAINRTSNEQILLNLVRLRYRDTPMFLAISNVSTQYRLEGRAEAGGTFNVLGVSGNEGEAGIGVTYYEQPTVSYTPLTGEEFVTQFLSPISLDRLLLLANSGWKFDRILRACVQQINGVLNAPRASGPTPDEAPEFEDFLRLASLWRELQLTRTAELELVREEGHESGRLFLSFPETEATREPLRELRRILDLSPDATRFELIGDGRRSGRSQILIRTRSVLGVLSYLSQGVEPPPAHVEGGLVTRTLDAQGGVFEWSRLLGELFRVRSSPERPTGAFAAIRHRGTWFYIADDDLETKSTFGLLYQLLQLQSGGARVSAPLLTLPVGG